jgi:phosphoribosylamine--glycine ligase
MRVLVVGSGGREHAICHAFSRSERVKKLYCASGNAGIAEIAECVPISGDNIPALAAFARQNSVDLTFVGPETPLALGISDEFEQLGLNTVGPSREAAQLEASKSFAKDFMARHGVPTARYLTAHTPDFAVSALESGDFGGERAPVVVKADGLAAGKGVIVAADRSEAIAAIHDLRKVAGPSAVAKIVLEECLFGREVSLLMFADGEDFSLMPPNRDHKRAGEGDTGPNTGGMGTITDDSLLTDEQLNTIVETIVRPTLHGCIREGFPFRGVLFLGLMITADGPKVLEYNVRFGDPETQSILVRLQTDLVDICEAMIARSLPDLRIDWLPGSSATVVLAAEGYPRKPRTGDVIEGVPDAERVENAYVFHAGTARDEQGRLVTAGGRVLGVAGVGAGLSSALETAYDAVSKISWRGMQYRRDIGRSAQNA